MCLNLYFCEIDLYLVFELILLLKRYLGPIETQAQLGPGPNGIQAQIGPVPKWDTGPNRAGPKWDPGPEPFRGGLLGQNLEHRADERELRDALVHGVLENLVMQNPRHSSGRQLAHDFAHHGGGRNGRSKLGNQLVLFL